MLNCLTFSIQFLAAQVVLLQGVSFLGGWAYLLFWFWLLLWLYLIFNTLLGFDSVSYMYRNRKNSLDFLFSSPSSTEWHMIGFSFSRFILEVLTLIIIFRTLKDKRRVLVLRKGCNICVVREISWKGMWADEGFCGRQGQCRVLGQQNQWRTCGA